MSTSETRAHETRGEARRTRLETKKPRIFRADIQALRAIAIGTVVINHLWPERLTGGFIGVDVFFVISGFLITGHLLREWETTGRIGFASFYARRVRRLLPAALLVLFVTIIAVWIFLPYPRWPDNALQTVSSAAYFENWTLAALSVDYMAHNAAASAVQHYWSLSVEEQFYLLWPVLIAVGAVIGQRLFGKSRLSSRIAVVVAIVGVASFTASIVFTQIAPAQAYFVTFTRAWQFAAGAVVALLVMRAVPHVVAIIATVVGYGGIAFSAFAFGPTTPYPGVAALVPTIATCLVIWAGSHSSREVAIIGSLVRTRPVQWIGDVSYSLYLWHWPLIVIVPFVIGAELTTLTKLAVLSVALILAWLTRRLVETPAQRALIWKSPRRSFIGMAAMMAVVIVVAGMVGLAGNNKIAAAQSVGIDAGADCVGPNALAGDADCDPSEPVPNPIVPTDDAYFSLAPECGDYIADLAMDDRQTTRICDFSGGGESIKVWLVGDSHAEQWQAPIFELAREHKWTLTISTFAGCPVAGVSFVGFGTGWGPGDYNRCRDWAGAVSDRIVADQPAIVFTSMAARQALVDDGSGRDHDTQFVEGLRNTWSRWTDAGVQVVPIADIPLNGEVRGLDCLLLNADSPAACAVPREVASPADPLTLATGEPMQGVWPIDLRNRFCDEANCFAAVGGIPVYFDADHMSRTYSLLLTPAFTEQIAPMLAEVSPIS